MELLIILLCLTVPAAVIIASATKLQQATKTIKELQGENQKLQNDLSHWRHAFFCPVVVIGDSEAANG